MKRDLLREIEALSGRTHAVILTHDVDAFFVQTLVLRALRKCGHPSLTIFADGPSARETYGRARDLLVGLGKRYRLVPIDLGSHRRWHPKAVLLSGPNEATLWVGSGNLTFGGWRYNAEVWTRFDATVDGTAPFLAVRAMLMPLLDEYVPVHDPVLRELKAAFSGRWADGPPGGHRVVGRVDGPSLLDEVIGQSPPEVRAMTLLAPYFGPTGAAVPAWRERVGADIVAVRLSEQGHDLVEAAVQGWPSSTDVRTVVDPTDEGAFVHAKAVRLEHRDGRITGWIGSANLSNAAWLAAGTNGNAELVAEVTGDLAATMLDELAVGEPPTWASERNEPDQIEPALRVLAARWDGRVLRVAWEDHGCNDLELLLDGVPTAFVPGVIVEVRCAAPPMWVELRGRLREAPVRSRPMWVDDDAALASGAYVRVLADHVETDGARARFDPDAWQRLVTYLARYAEPTEPTNGAARVAGTPPKAGEPFSVRFADLFAQGGAAAERIASAGPSYGGLQAWIRRVLGLVDDVDSDTVADEPEAAGGDEDEEVVEREEAVVSTWQPPREASGAERKRVLAAKAQLQSTLSQPGWAAKRGPDGVRSSLCMAGTLLGAASVAGWLTAEEIAETQGAIWPTLFHSDNGLEALTSEDQQSIATLDVAAAMAAWADGACRSNVRIHQLAGQLRWAALVMRWPMLFQPGARSQLAGALASFAGDETDRILEGLTMALNRADLLSQLVGQLQDRTTELRERVADLREIDARTLVWVDGRFWVALATARRGPKDNVRLTSVNADLEQASYRASFVIPIDELIARGLIDLPADKRALLADVVQCLLGK